MSLSGFEKLTNRASAYWIQQFIGQEKRDHEVSTTDGSKIINEISIIEISAKRAEEFLFSSEKNEQEEEKQIFECQPDLINQNLEWEIEEDQNGYQSLSSCSACHKNKREKRKTQCESYQSGKKRFTTHEKNLIMEQARCGTNYFQIAQHIPGSTVSQIKHQIRKQLKICHSNNNAEDDEIATIVLKLEQLLEDENIERNVKIQELKLLISNLESHLHQTKALLLQKYLHRFQQLS